MPFSSLRPQSWPQNEEERQIPHPTLIVKATLVARPAPEEKKKIGKGREVKGEKKEI